MFENANDAVWTIEGDGPKPWDGRFTSEELALYAAYVRTRQLSARAALLVIDLNRAVLGEDGVPLGIAEPGVGVASDLLSAARQSHFPVYFTTNEARASSNLSTVTRRAHGDDFDPEHAFEILPELKPRASERIIYKTRASAFFSTPLHVMLHEDRIETLIVAGCTTSGCVRATVVDAFQNGFDVIVVEDGVFDRVPLTHAVNLFDLHHKYATVIDSPRALELLGSGDH